MAKHKRKTLLGRPRKLRVKKKISITLDPIAWDIISQTEPGDRSKQISEAILRSYTR